MTAVLDRPRLYRKKPPHKPFRSMQPHLGGPTAGEYMTRMTVEEAWIYQGLGGALPAKVVRRLKVKAHMELLGRRECGT